jgi:hypothetical protein
MEKEFVTYELALRMKALGFNEPCLGSYYSDSEENFKEGAFDYRRQLNIEYSIYSENTYYILAPTYSQAFKWFREEHYLISSIYQLSVNVKTGLSSFEYMIDKLNNLGLSQFIEDFPYNTYEEAELACLEKLIEIVESKTEK